MQHEPKSQSHLINIISANRNHQPTFCLFLGAGASKSSGVMTASEMIADWRTMYCKICSGSPQDLEPLKAASWFNTEQEYAELFGSLFDSPSQRREYIEKCVETARPSWGYIYLTTLLLKGTFDTIFTTNFDDLINEACYRFTDTLRPMICAHDSSIGLVRISAKRPKVIKLHGDYLYDNIKNTTRELENLEENTKAKFKQFAREYGLIVMGYAGCDRSVMDTLEGLLKDDQNFPSGVYWCVHDGAKLSHRVEGILRFPKVKLIKTPGFDDFFAELCDELGLALQQEIAQPYDAVKDRLNNLLSNVESSRLHPRTKKDVDRLACEIRSIESNRGQPGTAEPAAVTERAVSKSLHQLTPFVFLATAERIQGKPDKAATTLLNHTDLTEDWNALGLASQLLAETDGDLRQQLSEKIASALKKIVTHDHPDTKLLEIGIKLLNSGEADIALDLFNAMDLRYSHVGYPPRAEAYLAINIAQCYIQKAEAIPDQLKNRLHAILHDKSDPTSRWGAAIVLEKAEDAKEAFLEFAKMDPILTQVVRGWPIWKLYLKLNPDM